MSLSVKTIVAIVIGTALFFGLGHFATIPIFPNIELAFQYAVLAFLAVVFGPLAGLVIGLAGHLLVEVISGTGIWWSWVIVSGLVGFGFGFVVDYETVQEDGLSTPSIIRFVVGVLAVGLLGWAGLAPLLDIIIHAARPVGLVFTDGLFAFIGKGIISSILGVVFLFVYNKVQPK